MAQSLGIAGIKNPAIVAIDNERGVLGGIRGKNDGRTMAMMACEVAMGGVGRRTRKDEKRGLGGNKYSPCERAGAGT
jgi:hypothetical protein